ncbi:MAG: CsbD family protein [Croceibacterium sp.]
MAQFLPISFNSVGACDRTARLRSMKGFRMGEIADKAKGLANEAIGKTKHAIGSGTSNADLKAEGDLQEAKGKLQRTKGAVKGVINKI